MLHNGKILVTNVQRFSLHDGPGIRTTVFLKGCSLHCPWCANPENIHPSVESFKKNGVSTLIGQYMSCAELYDIIIKDRVFYEGGGVTFSGGEPLLQIDSCIPLLDRLQEDKIHLCVETALFVPRARIEQAIKFFDLFYVDIKIVNKEKCREILGGDIVLFERNIDVLIENNKSFIIRVPIISRYTFDEKNISEIIVFLKQRKINEVELIAEHHLGNSKYASLGKEIPKIDGVTAKEMEYCKSLFEKNGIFAKICSV